MPEKFKRHIDELRKGITKEKLDAYVKEMKDWNKGFAGTDDFKTEADVAKMKADTVDYSNKAFKDKVKFTLDDPKSADSLMKYELLKSEEELKNSVTEVIPPAADETEKPSTSPEESDKPKERFTENEEQRVIAALDDLGIDASLVPFLKFEFKDNKLTIETTDGDDIATATFKENGKLDKTDMKSEDALEEAEEERDNLDGKTETAFEKLEIPESVRSRVTATLEGNKLTLTGPDKQSLGWVEFDEDRVKTSHSEAAAVRALSEKLESREETRPKELLTLLDDALDTDITFNSAESADSMVEGLIDALKRSDGPLRLKDGDLTDNEGNVLIDDFQDLLTADEEDLKEALSELISIDEGSEDYGTAIRKARHGVEMQKKESIGVTGKWIDASEVYLGQDGWEYKIGREGKMYARKDDVYKLYDEKDKRWVTLEKPVL
jgi:hypothetical protein